MEITFDVPSVESRTIQVDESDLASLGDIMRHLAIRHLQVVPLVYESAIFPEEQQVVELCKKYGIDYTQKGTVVNFFRALLLSPNEKEPQPQ
jgi:hypothetical protein